MSLTRRRAFAGLLAAPLTLTALVTAGSDGDRFTVAAAGVVRPDRQIDSQRDQTRGAETPLGEKSLGKPRSDEAPGEALVESAPRADSPEDTDLPTPKPKPELSPAAAALRDRVQRTLAGFQRQALNTRENTATEIMLNCLAFGCNTEVGQDNSSRKKLNGITCLCWNHPCAGYLPLGYSNGRISAKIGYGLQQYRSQLLAVLAFSRVPADYPLRVAEDVRTVEDLVEAEKLMCRSGVDLSLTLVGLAHYVVDDPTWENALGQTWSIQRIVEAELAQPVLEAPDGGMHRLTGLSYAVRRRARRGQPVNGEFQRAEKFVEEYVDYALQLQNPDGSWGPRFLAARGSSRDPATQLRSTGRVLEWLAVCLPEGRLEDPRVLRSADYVGKLLSSQPYRHGLRSLSTREIDSVMHALHALAVYDRRLFRPRSPKRPTPDVTEQAALR